MIALYKKDTNEYSIKMHIATAGGLSFKEDIKTVYEYSIESDTQPTLVKLPNNKIAFFTTNKGEVSLKILENFGNPHELSGKNHKATIRVVKNLPHGEIHVLPSGIMIYPFQDKSKESKGEKTSKDILYSPIQLGLAKTMEECYKLYPIRMFQKKRWQHLSHR